MNPSAPVALILSTSNRDERLSSPRWNLHSEHKVGYNAAKHVTQRGTPVNYWLKWTRCIHGPCSLLVQIDSWHLFMYNHKYNAALMSRYEAMVLYILSSFSDISSAQLKFSLKTGCVFIWRSQKTGLITYRSSRRKIHFSYVSSDVLCLTHSYDNWQRPDQISQMILFK